MSCCIFPDQVRRGKDKTMALPGLRLAAADSTCVMGLIHGTNSSNMIRLPSPEENNIEVPEEKGQLGVTGGNVSPTKSAELRVGVAKSAAKVVEMCNESR